MTTAELETVSVEDAPKASILTQLRALAAELNELSVFDLSTVVTLVLLFMYAGTDWYLAIPMKSLALVAILLPQVRASRRFWFLVTVLMVSANFYDRLLIDNHKYLMTYWCFAIFLASTVNDPSSRDRVLAFNGRILIGLCFFFAVIAKLLSVDYMNGGFFHHVLLIDGRFSNFTWLVGGVHLSTMREAKAVLNDIQSAYLFGVDIPKMQLASSARLWLIIKVMTWWTLCLESLIAVVFLTPLNMRVFEWGRRYLLWLFLLTTYAVALVPGFAWLLATMGLAQLPRKSGHYHRIAYIMIAAVVLQIYEVHWVSVIRSSLDVILPGAGSP